MYFMKLFLLILFARWNHLRGEPQSGSSMNENVRVQVHSFFSNHWPCNRWMHCYVTSKFILLSVQGCPCKCRTLQRANNGPLCPFSFLEEIVQQVWLSYVFAACVFQSGLVACMCWGYCSKFGINFTAPLGGYLVERWVRGHAAQIGCLFGLLIEFINDPFFIWKWV